MVWGCGGQMQRLLFAAERTNLNFRRRKPELTKYTYSFKWKLLIVYN
jgi:hypothetical protein